MRQITRISPCVLTGEYDDYNNPLYGYSEEIIVGADALRFRNGEGENAVCVGKNTTATAECSFAAGENSEAIGYCSFALGYNVETNNNCSFVCGRYNIPLSRTIFAVGCGNSSKNNNAITVYDTCQIDDISYSAGDTVINGFTAYASGKIEMPGITANTDKSLVLTGVTINSDGAVDIPKLRQLSNYATKVEVNDILKAHNSLSQRYTIYVSSNDQVISTICKTGKGNNTAIKNYATDTFNTNGSDMQKMILTIVGLFQTIGDSISKNHGNPPWAKSLKSALDSGSQNLKAEFDNYMSNMAKATAALVRNLKDF